MMGVRRDAAMLFQRVQAPPDEVLPPKAIGAAVEVTKPLKPSVKRVMKYDDSSRKHMVPMSIAAIATAWCGANRRAMRGWNRA